jgi:hypothetical protein
VLHDERMLDLYAARVCGSLVLADHKRALVAALLRMMTRSASRRRTLASQNSGAPSCPPPPSAMPR